MNWLLSSIAYFLAVGSLLMAIVQWRRGAYRIHVFAILLTGLAAAAVLVVPGFMESRALSIRVTVTACTITLLIAGGVCAVIALLQRWRLAAGFERGLGVILLLTSLGVSCISWTGIYDQLETAAGIVAAKPAATLPSAPQNPEASKTVGQSTPNPPTPEKPKPKSVLAQSIQDFLSGKREPAPEPSPTVTMTDENFRFTPPGKWEVLDAKKVNPIACYAAARYSEQQMVLIICEKVQEEIMPDLSIVAGFATANLKLIGTPKKISEETLTHQGMKGLRLEHEVSRGFTKTTVVHQLMMNRGYAWQIILSGRTSDAVALRKLSRDLLAGFSVIDLKRSAGLGIAEAMDPKFSSPLGWSIDLSKRPEGKWHHKWGALPQIYANADFGIMSEGDGVCLFIHSVLLPEESVSHEALADGFLSQLGVRLDSSAVTKRSEYQSNAARGLALEFDGKDTTETMYRYRARILQQGNRAWFLCGRASEHAQQGLAKLLPAFDCLVISDAPKRTTETTERPRTKQAILYNDIALQFDRRGDLDQAMRWLKHANLEENTDAVILQNLLVISARAGRPQEGLDVYERLAAKFPGNPKLQVEVARSTAQAGQKDRAIQQFEELYKSGYRNDDDLNAYLSLCLSTNDFKTGLEVFDRYAADKSTPAMRRTRATLLAGNDRRDEAIADLLALRKQEPNAAVTLYRLADFLAEAGRHQEILDHTREFLAKNALDADVLHYQGVAQLRLKRPDDAKKSFEAALAIRPTDPELKEMVAIASAQLGQGDNSQIKTVLKPVVIPAGLLEAPKGQAGDYVAGKNAFIQSAVRAVAIEKENDRIQLRTTEHRIVKIVDREGAESFNTLTFSFNPTAEDFHVNSLIVRDEKGETIGTGHVEDYYVLDEADSGMASNDRTVHTPVPGLKPGCTIEYSFTRLERLPAGETPFIRALLTNGLPVLRSSFLLRAPSGLVTAEATLGIKANRMDDALVWTVERPTPLVFEPLMAPWHTFLPSVTVGDPKGSWSKLGNEYLSSIKDRLTTESDLDPLVKKLTSGMKSEAEQVRALARYVQNELTYKAIEFGRRARIPQPVSAITRNRYGDCKDHALLLYQLLRAAKIPSHLALINSTGNFRSRFPSLDQFNHAIVYVPSGGLFIDCTQKSDAFQVSPAAFADYEALVLDPKQPKLTKVSGSARPKLTVQREVSSKPGGDLDIQETVTTSGDFSASLRDALRYRDPQGRRAAILAMLKRAEPTLEIRDFDIQGLLDSDKPLVFKIGSVVRRKAQEVGDQFIVHVPAAWEHVYLDSQPVEERLTPFEIRSPFQIDVSLKVQVPTGWRTAQNDVASAAPLLKFGSVETRVRNGNGMLEREASVTINSGNFPAGDYSKYVTETETLKSVCAPDLTFEKSQGTAGPR